MALDLVRVVVRLLFDIAARLGRHSFEGGGAAKRGNPEGAPAARPRALDGVFHKQAASGTLKILIVKKRARALRFRKPAPLLGLLGDSVGETPCRRWVKHRVHPQKKVGETPCPSTGAASLVGVVSENGK